MRRGILASREELRRLASRRRPPFDRIREALRRRCALILESSPTGETQWRSLWAQGRSRSAVQAAGAIQGRVLDLLVAYHAENNRAYRDRAVEELQGLCRWSTWVDPCHADLPADLCTAEAAVAVAVGLDWLWEDLCDADRRMMTEALWAKGIESYLRGARQQAFWTSCYHNWNAVVNGGCGLAALALSDERPEAREAYRQARSHLARFFGALDRDGGWDEGIGYWGYAMRYVLLLGEAASRLEDDQSIFHSRGMDSTGLFGVYFTPNGRAVSFGDSPSMPFYGALYLLPRHFRRPEVTWWLDTYAFQGDVATTSLSTAGLALLFRPARAATPRRPRPGFYVAVKTGDLAANHSQRDMNSVQLQVDGELLLTDPAGAPCAREHLSEALRDLYEVQARAHNTVVVAERDHRIDAQGRILEVRSGPTFRYAACDSGGALGGDVRFIRHVVMIVDRRSRAGRMLVILDDLDSGTPEKVETFWHTQGRIDLDAGRAAGTIVGRQAGLHFALASTARMACFTKAYSPDPHRQDNVLQTAAGLVGRALTVSAFSLGAIRDGVEIKQDGGRRVRVRVGRAVAAFEQTGPHLRLVSVSG